MSTTNEEQTEIENGAKKKVEVLFDAYGPLIYGYFLRLNVAPKLAEQLLMNVFIGALNVMSDEHKNAKETRQVLLFIAGKVAEENIGKKLSFFDLLQEIETLTSGQREVLVAASSKINSPGFSDEVLNTEIRLVVRKALLKIRGGSAF